MKSVLFRRLTFIFGLLAAAVALTGIVAAHFGIVLIGGANPDNKTIAFSAVLIWIFLGAVLAYQSVKSFQHITGWVVKAILVLIASVEGIEFIFSIQGSHFFIETFFVRAGTAILGPLSSPISPAAAGLAVPAAVALIFVMQPAAPGKISRRQDVISVLGLTISLVSITFVLSYFYGSRLLYGTQYIPIAALSALAAFFTGTALVASSGPNAIPVKYLIGNSTSARLLRAFIPLVLIIVLIENFVFVGLSSWFGVQNAILISASLVIFVIATAFVVGQVAGGIGRALERAERELVRKNDDLGAMNEELTAIGEELRMANVGLLSKERQLIQNNNSLNTLNEELTIAHEELRQANDELLAHERQLMRKNDDLNALNEELSAAQEELRQNLEELSKAEKAIRESEERYRSLFENMLEGFAYCRMLYDDQQRPEDFVYLSVNKAFEQIRETRDVAGKRATEVFPGIKEALPGLFEVYGKVALTGQQETFDFDFKPQGKWLHVSVYSPAKEHFVAVFEDITERKLAEDRLLQKNDELNAINEELTATEEELHQNVEELSMREQELSTTLKEKEILLSEIHHRVKNNLTAFISLLSLEGSTEDTPSGKLLKQDLQNRARSMALIHETLYKTHMYNEVDMGVYLTNLLDQIGNSFQTTRSVKIAVHADGILLDIPRATPAGLIVNELITNSFKYGFPESFDVQTVRNSPPTITFSLEKNDDAYTMTVRDNGIGLPPGFDLARTQTLGLKLVNFLAKHQMRATIEVNSDTGAEFIFRFGEQTKK